MAWHAIIPIHLTTEVIIRLLVITSLVTSWSSTHAYVTRIEQCEPIKIPRCQSMPYNLTQMPNLMHHNTQKNARLIFEHFEGLINQQCSADLLFFLCSVFVPICPVSLKSDAIPPCRKICESARAGCEPLMRSYNMSWPAAMECSRFPLYDKGLCVLPAAFVTPVNKKKCSKCKRKRPSFKMFRKHKYDYAVRLHVHNKFKVSKTAIKYNVKVVQVLFRGKVRLRANAALEVWSNATSKCACPPKMRSGREYVLMGHDDRFTKQLTITKHSAAAKWKDSWPRKVKRWRIKLQSRGRSQRRRKKNRRRQRQWERRPSSGQRDKMPNSTSAVEKKRPNSRKRRPRPGKPSINFGNPQKVPGIIDGYTHGGRFYTKTNNRNGSHAIMA